jgi:hypothetical protein
VPYDVARGDVGFRRARVNDAESAASRRQETVSAGIFSRNGKETSVQNTEFRLQMKFLNSEFCI